MTHDYKKTLLKYILLYPNMTHQHVAVMKS